MNSLKIEIFKVIYSTIGLYKQPVNMDFSAVFKYLDFQYLPLIQNKYWWMLSIASRRLLSMFLTR